MKINGLCPCLIGLLCEMFTCCSPHPIEQKPIPIERAIALKDEVREIIRPDCGKCHTSSLPTAKPKAVQVFDLDKPEWASTMSVHQLEKFGNRLNGLSDTLKSKVMEFVGTEMARRRPIQGKE